MTQTNTRFSHHFFAKVLLSVFSVGLSFNAAAIVTGNNDSASTSENTAVSIAVLDNDIAEDGNGNNVAANTVLDTSICLPNDTSSQCFAFELDVVLQDPENGTLSENVNGEIVYTPNRGFVGVDSFVYAIFQAEDSSLERSVDADEATVTVTVSAAQTGTSTSETQDLSDAIDDLCSSVSTPEVSESVGSIQASQATTPQELAANCDAFNNLSEEDRIDALTTISADQVTAEFTTTVSMVRQQNSNLLSRLNQLRQGAQGINISGLNLKTASGHLGGEWLQAAYDTMTSGGSAGEESGAPSALGFFINGSISTGDKDSNTQERGYDLDADNFTIGVDYRLTESLVTGLAYGVSSTEIEFNSTGDSMDNDGDYVFFYSSLFKDDFHLDLTFGFASGEIETARRIFIPMALDTIATGETDTDQFSMQLSSSYDFSHGAFSYGPYLRFDLIEGEIDGYQEANGGGFEVQFDAQDVKSRLLTFGGQAQYVMSYDWGVLIPSARFELKNEFIDEQDAITGRFFLDPSNATFSITADDIDTFWVQSGIGASAVFPYGISAYVDYETAFGLDSLTLDTFSFGGRWELAF